MSVSIFAVSKKKQQPPDPRVRALWEEPIDLKLAVASDCVAVFDSISVFAASTTLTEDLKTIWKMIPTSCCALLILVPIFTYLNNRRTGAHLDHPHWWKGR